MPRVGFPYLTVLSGHNGDRDLTSLIYRPLARATISVGERVIRWPVILDSGSDSCLFPVHLATLLGIKLSVLPGALTRDVGGRRCATYFENVMVDLGRGVRFEAQVGFTDGVQPLGFGLLGQYGFFSQYNVEFRFGSKEFLIEVP